MFMTYAQHVAMCQKNNWPILTFNEWLLISKTHWNRVS